MTWIRKRWKKLSRVRNEKHAYCPSCAGLGDVPCDHFRIRDNVSSGGVDYVRQPERGAADSREREVKSCKHGNINFCVAKGCMDTLCPLFPWVRVNDPVTPLSVYLKDVNMGTNFYLHWPTEKCSECGSVKSEPKARHIGKMSAGWVFTWHGWMDGKGLDDQKSWYEYLACNVLDEGAVIKNEYGDVYTFERFITMVTRARENGSSATGDSIGRASGKSRIGGDLFCFTDFS